MSLLSSPDVDPTGVAKKTAIDKDLKRIAQLDKAATRMGLRNLDMGFGLLFVMAVWAYTYLQSGTTDGYAIIAIASIIGAYMAMNIGANDVANNVGPAVGSKALTMVGALIIAAVFEAAGALIAGGDVVTTISKGIVSPESFADQSIFVSAMLAALLAAALWVNLATLIGAPVSTTHSIVGGVLGAGIAAAGMTAVDWPVMGKIAASWVISPVLGGIIAAAFLLFVKVAVIFKEDKVAAAQRWTPVLVGIMTGAFSVYLVMKGLKRVWKPETPTLFLIGFAAFAIGYAVVRFVALKDTSNIENTRKSVGQLFRSPLICAAALLSFAHGSNDVANAVGPLAAIVTAVTAGTVAAKVTLPLWVLAIGAIGIAIGLLLFGPKIIKIVGEKITKLDPIRAFCVALSAAITVIIASGLGLPVSSTHIAVGGVFGVGFLREFIVNNKIGPPKVKRTLPLTSDGETPAPPTQDMVINKWAKAKKRRLVRRRYLLGIIAAWLITVPASAVIAGLLFLVVNVFL
ncbi:MAG: inorganic phosphate transporter [Rhodospirillaceae bacterium]|nr:inorganic phosphate transporter [Rhodospirillaceae bacterium]